MLSRSLCLWDHSIYSLYQSLVCSRLDFLIWNNWGKKSAHFSFHFNIGRCLKIDTERPVALCGEAVYFLKNHIFAIEAINDPFFCVYKPLFQEKQMPVRTKAPQCPGLSGCSRPSQQLCRARWAQSAGAWPGSFWWAVCLSPFFGVCEYCCSWERPDHRGSLTRVRARGVEWELIILDCQVVVWCP